MTASTGRGDWRTLYRSFWDDADVHSLSHLAYRVLTTLKGTLPAIGIGVVYDEMLCRQCACRAEELAAAFLELEQPKPDRDVGWIVRQRNVVWVVNALRFEQSLNPNNLKKHGPFVLRQLLSLGDKPIVHQFRAYYAEWFGFPSSSPEAPSGYGAGMPSDTEGVTYPMATDSTGKVRVGKDRSGNGEVRSGAQRSSGDELADRAAGMDYLSRCVAALNAGMRANAYVSSRKIATKSQNGVVRWEQDGVPVEIAETVIAELCARFRTHDPGDQISSLKYFDRAVRERVANPDAAVGGASLIDQARTLYALAIEYNLTVYNGNSTEHAERVDRAAQDPRAGQSFRSQIEAIRITEGIGTGWSTAAAVEQIAYRLRAAGGEVA